MSMERLDLFRALAERRTNEVVITTMTATLQWPLVSSHPLDFDFLAFGMGHASDFGLGLALARPERKVIVLKGDGGLLMSLGSLVTMGQYGPPNLLVLLLENRSYEMTGGQPLAPGADFVALARGAGLENVERIDDLSAFEAQLPRLLTEPGPHFVVLPVTNSEPLPPVAHTDHADRVTRLREALGVSPPGGGSTAEGGEGGFLTPPGGGSTAEGGEGGFLTPPGGGSTAEGGEGGFLTPPPLANGYSGASITSKRGASKPSAR